MALKRKICEEDEVEKKTARMEEDRLSKLPDDLKLRILSLLDTKDALKTSMLSKTFISLWSWIPVMEFNSFDLHNLHVFDKFVNAALRQRDRSGSSSAKLERLTFIRRQTCSAELITNVFEHAFSHGVNKLEAYMQNSISDTWPVCLNKNTTYSFQSLTSLILEVGGAVSIGCPFLGPRSGSFKNLTLLHLRRAIITDLDPFSGFPVLERLTLVACVFSTEGKALNVCALNLSELTIRSDHNFNCCQLTTPRLRSFEYQGYCEVFRITHDDELHDFDTMVIGCEYLPPDQQQQRKRMLDNLLSLFSTLNGVQFLTLFWSCAEFLSSFQEELEKRASPFRKLKHLKMDFNYEGDDSEASSHESIKIASDVMKAYFLQNSPNAQVTTIYPDPLIKCKK